MFSFILHGGAPGGWFQFVHTRNGVSENSLPAPSSPSGRGKKGMRPQTPSWPAIARQLYTATLTHLVKSVVLDLELPNFLRFSDPNYDWLPGERSSAEAGWVPFCRSNIEIQACCMGSVQRCSFIKNYHNEFGQVAA